MRSLHFDRKLDFTTEQTDIHDIVNPFRTKLSDDGNYRILTQNLQNTHSARKVLNRFHHTFLIFLNDVFLAEQPLLLYDGENLPPI